MADFLKFQGHGEDLEPQESNPEPDPKEQRSDSSRTSVSSLLWNYFTRMDTESSICNDCRKTITTKGSNTSNMVHHLRYHHFSDYLQVRKQANLHVPESVPPNANKKRKQFMCDLCGAEFPDSYYNKTRHMAIKHQIYLGNKYTCDACGKVCWSKYDFHKHKQIHSDEASHTW